MLRLKPSPQPRLVSWAASAGGRVEVHELNGVLIGDEPSEFGDFTLLPPDTPGSYQVSGVDAALAVYELTDASPEGYTVEGITFRDRVGSDRRGRRGQTEARVRVVRRADHPVLLLRRRLGAGHPPRPS